MKKLYTALLLVVACMINLEVSAGQKLRVFFMGNSYTYTNDLPGMIADIAASMGDTLVYDNHTPGGYTFEQHWGGADPCFKAIKTRSWDYIVMQEQSQRPAFGQYLAMPNHPTYTFARQYANLIRDSAKCTTAMFYMTWGYKDGDADNCPFVPSMCTYEGMDSALRVRYLELADSFDAVISPTGAVRRYLRQNHPGIDLYQPDGSHPSLAGTYAAACCFYAALFKKDPSLTNFNSSLPAADAATIKAAAKIVVYDSLVKWGFLGNYDLSAAYSHSINGTQVSFTNQSSSKTLAYSWNFGDGNSSTLKNPVHTYASKGDYTVTLTVSDGNGCSRVISKKVNMISTRVKEQGVTSFTVVPNPAAEFITIQTTQAVMGFNIRITDVMGKTVYQESARGGAHKVDLSSMGSGMYYVTVYNETGVLHYDKFVKQ